MKHKIYFFLILSMILALSSVNAGFLTTTKIVNPSGWEDNGTVIRTLNDNPVDISGNVSIGGGFNNGGIDLETTGNIQLAGDILIQGDILSIVDQEINQSFLPSEDNKFDLGSAILRWKDAFFGGVVTVGNIIGSNWNQSGTDLFPKEITSNVGIGTTTPSTALEVKGGNSISPPVIFNTNNNQPSAPILHLVDQTGELLFTFTQDSNRALFKMHTSSGNEKFRISVGSDGQLISFIDLLEDGFNFISGPTDTEKRLTILGNGNVGIGTSTPNGLLTVTGTTSAGIGIVEITQIGVGRAISVIKTSAAPNRPAVEITQTSTNNDEPTLDIQQANENEVAIGVRSSATLNNHTFVVMGDGSVGIGTSTPVAPLEIQSLAASMRQTRYSDTGVQSAGLTIQRSRGTTVGTDIIVQDGDRIANFNLRGYDGATYRTAASIQAFIDGEPGVADMPGRLTFLTTVDGDSSATERMRIDSSGNVGIGTTSPANTLEVAGNVSLQGNTSIGMNTFFVDNTSGLVGIGTNNPSDDLYIAVTKTDPGGITLEAGGRSPFLTIRTDTDTKIGGIRIFDRDTNIQHGIFSIERASSTVTGATQNDIYLGTTLNANTNLHLITESISRITINSTGNIGIGTTTPDFNLEVIGDTSISGNLNVSTLNVTNANANATFQGDVKIVGTLYGASPLEVGSSVIFDDDMVINISSGNIGIGTANPAFPLDVNGIGRFIGTLFAPNIRVNSVDDFVSTANAGINFGGSSKFINFETDATERMRITSDGSIGIGTDSPDGLLNVFSGSAGTVTARAAGDDLVIEHSTNGGMSILTPNTSTSTIIFGSPGDPLGADIKWNHDNNVFIIGSRNPNATLRLVSGGGVTALNINKNQNFDFQDGNLVTTGTLGAGVSTLGATTITGDLDVDGTTFHVDAADNKVGIGTTSPNFLLDVAGKINATACITNDASGDITTCTVGEIRGNATENKICLCTTANNWKCATVS